MITNECINDLPHYKIIICLCIYLRSLSIFDEKKITTDLSKVTDKLYYIKYTSPWTGFEPTTLVVIAQVVENPTIIRSRSTPPYLYGGILSSCISLTFRKCHIPVHNLIIINLVGLTRSTTKSFMSFISVVAVTASKSYTKLLVGQFSIVLLMLVHSFIQSPSFFEAAYTDQEQTFKFLFKFFLNKIRQWISIMMSDFDL